MSCQNETRWSGRSGRRPPTKGAERNWRSKFRRRWTRSSGTQSKRRLTTLQATRLARRSCLTSVVRRSIGSLISTMARAAFQKNNSHVGTFYASCRVENIVDRRQSTVIRRLLVDTRSEYSWIPTTALEGIGVHREKKDVPFVMANGQQITRSVGFVIIRLDKFFTVDEVVFAEKGDLTLLGARSLEGLNLRVDSRHKKLLAVGPLLAATASTP